ncbi:extracellular solute-binding protein [Lachnospiraceae bacterium 54-53]
MRMKRLTAMFLCAALVAAAAGCSGQSTSKEEQTEKETTQAVQEQSKETSARKEESAIRISWWGSQARNDGTVKVLDFYSSRNEGITFQPEFSDWGGYWSKLATQVAGNSMPDIIQMDRTYLSTYVSKGQLEDLTPYIESGLLDVSGIPESSLNTGKMGDGIYALVLGVNVPCLFYDKDVVEQAGITLPEEMNYEEFFKICKTIYEKTGVQTDLDYGKEETYLNLYLRDKGYSMFDEDGTKLGIPDEKPLTDFFQMYVDGLEEGYLVKPEVFMELDPSSVEQNTLVMGKSWCTILFSNQMTSIVAASDKNIGITSVPADDLKALQFIKPSQYFCISSASGRKEDAVKYLDWFINDNEANEILLGERGVPANTEVAQYIAPMLTDTERTVIDFIEKVNNNCSEINPPVPEGSNEVAANVNKALEAVCYGTKTPEEAAKEFFQQSNQILSANEK